MKKKIKVAAAALATTTVLSFDTTFTGEKLRGTLTSLVTGSISTGLHAFGIFGLGLSPVASAFLFLYLLGGPLSYTFDILFAKRDFASHRTGELPVRLPYSAFGDRFRWLARSFARRHFVRFIVTIIIETLTGLVMLDAAIRAMNAHGVLMEHRLLRDAAAAVIIAVVNFFLFGNILRFDWAYKEAENPTMNIAVLAWLGMSMIMFSVFKSIRYRSPDEEERARASTKM